MGVSLASQTISSTLTMMSCITLMLVPYMTDAILNKLVREHGQVRMIQYMHIYVLLTARIS